MMNWFWGKALATTTPIRLVIAEDQQLIRRAFATILALESDIEVVAQASDGLEALNCVRFWQPDIVLMDLQMPRMGGVAATRQIVRDYPVTQVIVLTTFDTDDLVFDAISAGAQGYLLKDASEEEILETIRAVKNGHSRLAPHVARKVLEEFRRIRPGDHGKTETKATIEEALTEREAGILALIAAGKGNREIAELVFLAEGTVKNYVSRIMEKLHARSRTELAIKALGSAKR